MSEKLLLKSYTVIRRFPKNYSEGDLDFCKREFSYQTLDVSFVECRNCFVNYKGFVYNGYFQINERSLLSSDYYRGQFTIQHYIKKVLLKRKRSLPAGRKYLLAFDEWGHVHYHWFCDTLPRIYSARDILRDHYLLLPAHSRYIESVGLETLKILGLNPKGIEFIDYGDLLRIDDLTLVTRVGMPGYTNDKLMKCLSKEIIRRNGLGGIRQSRKIYISREGADFRKVLNEGDVQEVVKSFGYEVVKYEEMDIRLQMEVTAAAKSIVSIHGAGLTNMMFMQPGGNVLEFRRDRVYHNQCFWHLADALDLNYFYLFGEPDDESLPIEADGCNLTIDLAGLAETLKLME